MVRLLPQLLSVAQLELMLLLSMPWFPVLLTRLQMLQVTLLVLPLMLQVLLVLTRI